MPSKPRTSPSFRELVELELEPRRKSTESQRKSIHDSAPREEGAGLSWHEHPDDDIVGLSLSGGGIRSATFNLGLLQGLSELKLLDTLDYLSTASGGGYIGGFWSAWRARPRATKTAPSDPFSTEPLADRPESTEVRHLREFSNFLNPRLGLLSYDTGRLAATVFSSTIPALAAAIALIVLAFGAWQLAAYGILGRPAVAASGEWQSLLVLTTLSAGVLAFQELVWIRRGESWTWWFAAAWGLGVAVLVVFWWFGFLHIHAHLRGSLVEGSESANSWLLLLLPAGAWMSNALVLVVLRLFVARTGMRQLRVARGALDRIIIRFIALTGIWTVFAGLWITGAALLYLGLGNSGLRLTGFAGLTAALGAAFGVLHRFFSQATGRRFGGRLATMIKPRLPQLFAYAALTGLMLTVVAGMWWVRSTPILDAHLPLGIERTYLPYVAALIVTVVTLAFFNPNEIGLHGFYRSRLARAYLGASTPKGHRQTEERAEDDLPLDQLTRQRPLHLICCAANDLAASADHLGNLHRGATSAVLSPVGFSVGGDWVAWTPGDPQIPTLASAMTASGAAFNSQMGSKSMEFGPAVTFLMAALNLRLGLWLPHPLNFLAKRYRAFAGSQFYSDLFGQSRASGPHVHLSDGGHFENMALYELIRRHCRYVIASDCGADADIAFDDLGNVVRRVREDFGVEIEIDLSPLRPDASGFARQAMVSGDVRYPNGDMGVLLVFKPTLTGTEPADVLQYHQRNDAFPHESTGDQFYDEAQWESYRRLGLHCARAAFRDVIAFVGDAQTARSRVSAAAGDPHLAARRWVSRVFARARMQWQPVPAGLESRLTNIVDRAAQLDTLLQQKDCGRVLREVYKEVDELDRLAKQRGRSAAGDSTVPDSEESTPAELTPDELRTSLYAIRRALLFMEQVHLTEDLGRRATHARYLGIMNYFARWAYAPLFRMWWPMLKSLYAHDFTRFLELQFRLPTIAGTPGAEEHVLTDITPESQGFAMHCWRLHGLPQPRSESDERFISFSLAMHYRGEAAYRIQAAQLLFRRAGNAAVWDAEHFFVPPGLWGVGIGGHFLSCLTSGLDKEFADGRSLSGVERLFVRISAPTHLNQAKRKEIADLTQLYRDAGFTEERARRVDEHTLVLSPGDRDEVMVSLEIAPGREREWWFRRRIGA